MELLQKLSRVSFSAFFLTSIFALSIAFVGGVNAIALALVAPVVLFVLYLGLKQDRELVRMPLGMQLGVGAFILAALVSCVYSYNSHQSVIALLWFVVALVVGAELAVLVRREGGLAAFGWGISILALIAVLFGGYLYVVLPDYSYLRLIGPFFSHNPFAGFLLAPLALLVPMTLVEKRTKYRRILTTMLIVIAVGFCLTLSRGAFLSLVGAWVVVGASMYVRRRGAVKRRALIWVLGIFAIATAVAYGAYTLKMHFAPMAGEAQPSTTAADPVPADNSITSRIQYMHIGLRALKHNPLGVGIGAYKEAEPVYRTSPVYQTTDPHNLFIRLFAEVGFVGGLAFVCCIVALVFFLLRALWQQKNTALSPLQLGLIAGSLAIVLHMFIEADWYFPGNIVLGVAWFMATYAVLSQAPVRTGNVVRGMRVVAMLVMASAMTVGLCVYIATIRADDGIYFAESSEFDASEASFEKALQFDRWNPQIYADYANMFILKSFRTHDTSTALYEHQLDLLDQAIRLQPHYAHLYDGRSYTYRLLKDDVTSERDTLRAIDSDPSLNLAAYVFMSHEYVKNGRYDEAIALVDRALAYYPPAIFKNTFWVSPQKPNLRTDVMMLIGNKAGALHGKGMDDEAQATVQLMGLYAE